MISIPRLTCVSLLLATAAWTSPAVAAPKCAYWSMTGWQPVYSGVILPPGSNPSRPEQMQGVLIVQERSGNDFKGIMQVEYFKTNAEGLQERTGEDGVLTGAIRQSARELRFTVSYPTFGTMEYEGWIVDDGRVEGLRRTSTPGTGDPNDPNSWSNTWHMKAPLPCASPPAESPFKVDRSVDVSGVVLLDRDSDSSSKARVENAITDRYPQPLPPVEVPGAADVALNPQPLPPVDGSARAVALNPQPLPPVERPGVDALNPQPLPPVERPGVADVALNPQPLPPVDGSAHAVALNPQPLPPVDRPGVDALNPQPLPPVRKRSRAVSLNPQPLPPVAKRDGGITLDSRPRARVHQPGVTETATALSIPLPKDVDPTSWRAGCIVAIPGSYVEVPGRPQDSYTEIVMRNAQQWDTACVWRAEAARIAKENEEAPLHWIEGPFGPHSCKPGFVWREAVERDDVCVTPDRRQAIRDNAKP